MYAIKGKSYPSNRPRKAIGFWDVEVRTFSRHKLTGGGKVISFKLRPAAF
jgi:hypothetical protein